MAQRYSAYINPSLFENWLLELLPRIENSAYGYDKSKIVSFRGRPAQNIEKRQYRLLSGVNTTQSSTYVVCSNLPDNIKDGDKVRFIGRVWTVASVGFYYNDLELVNAGVMNPEYIISRCKKGIVLE